MEYINFKVQFFWKGHKDLKLLSKNNCIVKTGGRFFLILWPSQNNFIRFKSNSANNYENISQCAVIRIQGVSARSKLVKKQHSQQITGPPLSLYRWLDRSSSLIFCWKLGPLIQCEHNVGSYYLVIEKRKLTIERPH